MDVHNAGSYNCMNEMKFNVMNKCYGRIPKGFFLLNL